MRHPRTPQRSSLGLDAKMTPMIDVILQLLIFFLCTAGFAIPEAILPTELPREGGVSIEPSRPREDTDIVRVELSAAGKSLIIRMNGQVLASLDDLLERLRQISQVSQDIPVILDVASMVPIGEVVNVYDGALSSGLNNVHFAAERSH